MNASILNKKPITPYEKLRELDRNGDAYWIETRPMDNTPMLAWEVWSFGPEWIELAPFGGTLNSSFWVRWEAIGPFCIVES